LPGDAKFLLIGLARRSRVPLGRVTKVEGVGSPDHTPTYATPQDLPQARSALRPETFRGLAAAAYAASDGRQLLLDVVRRLGSAERPAGAPPALTDEQLAWVLDQLEDEALF
jgi:hypothetical protein